MSALEAARACSFRKCRTNFGGLGNSLSASCSRSISFFDADALGGSPLPTRMSEIKATFAHRRTFVVQDLS